MLRGVVRAAFTQTVILFFVAHTKLTVWLCLAKLTPPNTPDTPCLHFIRVYRVDVPFNGVLGAGVLCKPHALDHPVLMATEPLTEGHRVPAVYRPRLPPHERQH